MSLPLSDGGFHRVEIGDMNINVRDYGFKDARSPTVAGAVARPTSGTPRSTLQRRSLSQPLRTAQPLLAVCIESVS